MKTKRNIVLSIGFAVLTTSCSESRLYLQDSHGLLYGPIRCKSGNTLELRHENLTIVSPSEREMTLHSALHSLVPSAHFKDATIEDVAIFVSQAAERSTKSSLVVPVFLWEAESKSIELTSPLTQQNRARLQQFQRITDLRFNDASLLEVLETTALIWNLTVEINNGAVLLRPLRK